MKILELAAEILSPVVVEPAISISGSALRGALAANYIAARGLKTPAADPLFQDLFLNDNVLYGNLYPGRKVLPATAYSCKRHPGFFGDGGHGIQDFLFDSIAGKMRVSCPQCGQDLKKIEGFHDGKRLCSLKTSLVTHVGIDRSTSTSAVEILYSDVEIDEGQALYGQIIADDSLVQPLLDLFQRPLRIGRSKTRGKGQVEVTVTTVTENEPEKLQSKWERWSERATAALGSSWKWDFLFSIGLASDSVVVDQFLWPAGDLSDEITWLPSATIRKCAFGSGTLELVYHISQMNRIQGWNSVHRLPKDTDYSIQRGSVFVYGFRGSHGDRQELYKRLYRLSIEGIGLRRNEGFGRLEINDFFHCDFAGGGHR